MKKKVILIQPRMGFLGELVKHPPLSLLYLSTELIKNGYEVEIIDNRVYGNKWQKKFIEALKEDVVLVGCTVMTGTPIIDSIEASKIAKRRGIPVVWGGAHPTCLPEQTIVEEYIDFIIRGYGSFAIYKLAEFLLGNNTVDISKIMGLSYKKDGEIFHNDVRNEYEIIHWKDIPYDTIKDYTVYSQLDHLEIIFPIYSVYGCPYQCTFCISPVRYRNIKQKWVTLNKKDVVDHIEYLQNRFGATYIYFYDEDSFVKIDHIENILKELRRRNINIKLGFRGARIDEIERMSDEYISNLVMAGTNMLHIGLESGSQAILDLYRKNIDVNQIIKVNRKLARNKKIKPLYNWIVGAPSETIEDLKLTKNLLLKIVNENSQAIIPRPNLFQPLPSTFLYKIAIKNGYRPPKRLVDWINMEQNVGDFKNAWISKKTSNYTKMLYVASFFMDKKLDKVIEGRSFFLRILKYIALVYYPIINFRVKNDIYQLLIEYHILKLFERLLRIKHNRTNDTKKVSQEFTKYILVGILNNLVNFGVFFIIVFFYPMSHVLAATIGFLMGGVTNYIFNKQWTFKKKNAINVCEVVRFISVTLSSLLINAVIVYTVVDIINFSKYFGWLCGVGTATIYNFLLFKIWVFRTRE